MSKTHYASVGPDGLVGSVGHAPEHMRDAIGATHVILSEMQFTLLELRGVSGIRYRFEDGELHPLPPEVPAPDDLARAARLARDALLHATDKMMWPDYPLAAEHRPALLAYRDALRHVPQQDGFPGTVAWPTKDW